MGNYRYPLYIIHLLDIHITQLHIIIISGGGGLPNKLQKNVNYNRIFVILKHMF